MTADGRPWWVAVVNPPGGPARAFASWQAADAGCAAEYCRALLATRPDLPAAFVFVNGVRLSLYPGPVRPGGWQSRGALAKRAAARAALLAKWRVAWAGKLPPTGNKSAHCRAPERTQPPAAGSGS